MQVSSGWSKFLSVIYVMVAKAISGIPKDLNKMRANVPSQLSFQTPQKRMVEIINFLIGKPS